MVPKEGARYVVVDSTGVNVYGDGEWKIRQHGSKFDNQAVELFIKCAALNRMIQIAKPNSYEVEAESQDDPKANLSIS